MSRKQPKVGDSVLVVWRDACHSDEYFRVGQHLGECLVHTVGHFMYRTHGHVGVALGWMPSLQKWRDMISIPDGMVLRVDVLARARGTDRAPTSPQPEPVDL